MLGQAGIFGIGNSSVALAVTIVLLLLVVLWIALIYWTFADARRRVEESSWIGAATAVAVIPFIGPLLYMIVRPPEYLEDVRERELEIQATEARLADIGVHTCPYCDHEIEKDFLRCPNCMRKLKDPCQNCGRPLDPAWQICPYCEQAVRPSASSQQQRRRRRSGSGAGSAGQRGGGGGNAGGGAQGASNGGGRSSGGGQGRGSGASGEQPTRQGDSAPVRSNSQRGGSRPPSRSSGQANPPSESDFI